MQLNTSKNKTKWAKDLNRHLKTFKEGIKMTNKHMKRCSNSLEKYRSKPQWDAMHDLILHCFFFFYIKFLFLFLVQPIQHIKKQRHLPTEVRLVKATIFPVVMYWCESWTIKKAECRRIDAFELWCWRRLLRVPWTARRSNQSILKEISPEYSLEGLMLKVQ